MTQEKNYLLNSSYRAALRFEGKFVDADGVPYTLHILHHPPTQARLLVDYPETFEKQELRLGAKPIILQRESERLSGLIATKARLSLVSETDGMIRYLHKLPEGAVKLVVWRSEELYYLGTLDPESYEEDYTRKNRYMVELSFSDFGCAQRLRHKLRGHKRLGDWVGLFVKASLSHAQYGMDLSLLPLPSPLYEDNSSLLMGGGGFDAVDEWDDELMQGLTDEIDRIMLQGYVSSQAFCEDEGQSRTIYDSLDGILSSLGLRLEQRAGKFVLYDTDWLLAQSPLRLKDPRRDTVYVADEQYTAINIEIKSRAELYSKALEIPEVQEGIVHQHPRIDRPDLVAYNAVLQPIPKVSGAYYVTTTPKTLGERDSFIALCWHPVEHKAARYPLGQYPNGQASVGKYQTTNYQNRPIDYGFLSGGRMQSRQHRGEPGDHVETILRWDVAKVYNESQYIYVYPNVPFGIERWHELPRADMPRNLFVPWLYKTGPIGTIHLDVRSGSDVALGIEASLFFSLMPSLYQELTDRFLTYLFVREPNGSQDLRTMERKSENYKYFSGIRSVLVPAELVVSDGATSYALSYEVEPYTEVYRGVTVHRWDGVTRHRLKWVSFRGGSDTPRFYIPFGGDKFAQDTWVKASSEYIDLGLATNYNNEEVHKGFWQYEALYDKGLYIPAPPISGQATLQLYGSVSMAYEQERYMGSSGTPYDNGTRQRQYVSNMAATQYSARILMLEWHQWLPSYVLLKDVRLSVVDTRSSKSEGDVKRHASINDTAYELLKSEPIISTDEGLPDNSPTLIRTPSGGRSAAMYRINWASYYRDLEAVRRGDFANNPKHWPSAHHDEQANYPSSSHLLASRAFEHYGERRHSLEGTFRTVQALAPLLYGEHTYMILEEEQDLRAGKSDYKLAEISPVRYSPALQAGEVESGDNKHYIIN